MTSKPMPLFPLDRVILMPHGVHAVHIFEDRYVQMVEDVLDGAGQIAMAVFDADNGSDDHDNPPIKPEPSPRAASWRRAVRVVRLIG